jgi:hypothetical protein
LRRFTHGVATDSDARRLAKCVAPLLDGDLPPTLAPFLEWMPRVARFSFEGAVMAQPALIASAQPANGHPAASAQARAAVTQSEERT